MAMTNPPLGLQNAGATHTAAQLRTYLASLQAGNYSTATFLRARGGVHPTLGGEFAITQTGSPSMGVLVESGVASVPGTEGGTQGNYFVCNDAQVTLSVTAAHATLPRIDIVVVNVRDSFYSGASNDSQLQVVAGTPASSPVAPTAPFNSITLAQIAVAAAATSITNANITDQRFYMAAVGGVMNIRNIGALPPSAQIGEGQLLWTLDTNRLYVWDGAAASQMFPGDVGVVAWGNRLTSSSTTTGEIGVLRLDNISVLANRMYRIWTSPLRLLSTAADDTVAARLRISTSGAATTASTSLAELALGQPPFTSQSVPINAKYIPGSNQTLSVLLTVTLIGGTGTVSMTVSSVNPNIDLIVEDVGPAPSDTGVDI